MRTIICGGKVVMPHRILEGASVLLEDERIAAVYADGRQVEADEVIDASGCYVTPGLIDLHSHGGGGHDFMDGTVEAVIGAAKAHMIHGTTSIAPTTLTCLDEELFAFFDNYRKARETMTDGPNLLGIHLEGPYFAMSQRGAQDPQYLKTPEYEHYMRILEHEDIIGRISAAPELPGAMELGTELRKRGIIAAIGHSDAEYEQVMEAFEHGYTHVTHLYSGMSALHRKNAYRHLGVVESAYLMDGLTVEIIADGSHLPPELLKLILRTKSMDQIILITDSMRGAGMPEGSVNLLGSLAHGQPTVIQNGVAFTMDRQSFAGSVCTADRCIRTMVQKADLPIHDAVRMMTLNPARLAGIADRKGMISPGMDADICLFDADIMPKCVIVAGKTCFEA